jgi:hypothetical protein
MFEVVADYFRALGVPLRKDRAIEDRDTERRATRVDPVIVLRYEWPAGRGILGDDAHRESISRSLAV